VCSCFNCFGICPNKGYKNELFYTNFSSFNLEKLLRMNFESWMFELFLLFLINFLAAFLACCLVNDITLTYVDESLHSIFAFDGRLHNKPILGNITRIDLLPGHMSLASGMSHIPCQDLSGYLWIYKFYIHSSLSFKLCNLLFIFL
jgi:hypothetical protein